MPITAETARDTLILIHPSVSDRASIALSYAHNKQYRITDIAGNALVGFNRYSISATSFVALKLASEDDTGASAIDGITRFVGSEVSIEVSLTSGSVFSEGDEVVFYSRRNQSAVPSIVKRAAVSSLLRDGVNAIGSAEFVAVLPISAFPGDTETLLSATYIPAGMVTNERGSEILIVRDYTPPAIIPSVTEKGQTRIVSATDRDSKETVWMFKQISSDTDCEETVMSFDAKEYIEGSDLTFDTESDNDTVVCFSVTDLAGNTEYRKSDVVESIDTTVPTVSDVVITDADELTVTMNEPVYSTAGPDVDDFVIFVNDVAIYTTAVRGIPHTPATADDSFIVVAEEIFEAGDTISLSYVGSSGSRTSELIRDTIGNTLVSFEKLSVASPKSITISLDAKDDTGSDNADGYTNLGDDSDVSFVIELSEGSFSNGDRINVYENDDIRTLESIKVGIRRDQVNAHGERAFTLNIPKSGFIEGSFTLSASFTPRLNNREVSVSPRLAIIYDADAPDVTITSEVDSSGSLNLTATDTDSETTEWVYKQTASDVDCDADSMHSDAKEYTEGEELTFDAESDNDTVVCFSVTDLAGNTMYEQSDMLEGIDTVAPSVAEISIIGSDRVRIAMSEPVYSTAGPDIDDFVLYVDDVVTYVSAIEGLARTVAASDDSFTVVTEEIFDAGEYCVAFLYRQFPFPRY